MFEVSINMHLPFPFPNAALSITGAGLSPESSGREHEARNMKVPERKSPQGPWSAESLPVGSAGW